MQRLTLAEVASLLAQLAGLQVVLIGGQALNYWCFRYGDSVDLGSWLPASRDIDFQGAKADVEICAQRVGGAATVAGLDDDPNHIGYVVAPSGLIIDFIGLPFGLDSWEEVQRGAVPVPIPVPGSAPVQLRVMNPIQCLRSRAHNVIEMPDKYDNEHGVAQLRASMQCARAFIMELLAANQRRLALKAGKSVYWLTRSKVGVDLFAGKHQIDLFKSLPADLAVHVGARQQEKMVAAIRCVRAARERRLKQNGPPRGA